MVTLGDTVRDTISGFEGVAVSRHIYLNGCHRITVQPKWSEGKLPEAETFDEPQLELTKAHNMVESADLVKTGGPMPYVDKRRY